MRSALMTLLQLAPRAIPAGQRGGRKRIVNQMRSKIHAVTEELLKGQFSPLAHGADGPNASDPTTSRIRRAVALVKRGYLGRAAMTLRASTIAPPTDATIDALASKQKAAPVDQAFPPCPDDVSVGKHIAMPPKVWRQILKEIKNGAAAGISGLNGDIMNIICGDECINEAMQLIVLDIANARFPSSSNVGQLLLRTRIIPFIKKDGGIRDIKVGEVILKLAALFVLRMCDVSPAFPSIQLGVGSRGGAESAVHYLSTVVEASRNTQRLIIALDAKEAFNSIRRDAILEDVLKREELGPAHRFLHWSLTSVSQSLYFDAAGSLLKCYRDEAGVQQGSVWAAISYALAVQKPYEDCIHGLDAAAVAVLDDLTIDAGSVTDALTAVRRIEASLKDRGVELNRHKSIVFVPSGQPLTEEELTLIRDAGLPAPCYDALTTLGMCVSNRPEAIEHFMMARIDKQQPFFEYLMHEQMPHQVASALLRVCGLPAFNYLQRTAAPAQADMAMQSIQNKIMNVFAHIAHIDANEALDEASLTRMLLPIRLGGAGLGDHKEINIAAYAAARAQAASLILSVKRRLHVPAEVKLPSDLELENALRYLADHGADSEATKGIVPADLSADTYLKEAAQHGTGKSFQKLFCLLMNKHKQRHLYEQLDAKQKVAWVSSAWTTLPRTTLPLRPEFELKNEEVTTLNRAHLGFSLLPADRHPKRCPACNKEQVHGTEPQHLLVCQQFRGGPATERHRHLVNTLSRLGREAGLTVEIEPKIKDDSLRRADIRFQSAHLGKPLYVDVKVVQPACATHVAAALVKPLGACEKVEKDTQAEYVGLIDQQRAGFVPFVIEAYGAIGGAASSVIDTLAAEANFHGLASSAEFQEYAMTCISLALWRGTTFMAYCGAERPLAHAVRRGVHGGFH
jgi:hypothetical protein